MERQQSGSYKENWGLTELDAALHQLKEARWPLQSLIVTRIILVADAMLILVTAFYWPCNLKVLDLRGCHVGSALYLLHFPSFQVLEELYLRRNGLEQKHFAAVVTSFWQFLRVLDLSQNRLCMLSVGLLTTAPWHVMQELNLSSTRLDGAMLETLV